MALLDGPGNPPATHHGGGHAHPAVIGQVEVPGFQWSGGADPVEQQCRLVEQAWERLGERHGEALGRAGAVDVIALGLAGGAGDLESRRRLAPLLAERLGATRVLLTGDDVTNHLGALGGSPGVVIAAGTGVACLAVTADGGLTKTDGLGYLFGDAGGGFSLGLAGLRAAVAAVEGRGPETALTDRAEAVAGAPLPLTMRTWYKRATLTADVAAFASEVGAAAEFDPVARELCLHAGHDLAVTAAAAVRRCFPDAGEREVAVSWGGGVLRSYPVVFGAFAQDLAALCPEASLRDPLGDALRGAVHLAFEPDVPHLAGVVVAP